MLKVFALMGLALTAACAQQPGAYSPAIYQQPLPYSMQLDPALFIHNRPEPTHTTCRPSYGAGFTCTTSQW